jgi:hypothetical protein
MGGAMAALGATIIAAPVAAVAGAWGISKIKKTNKERAIKAATADCLARAGYSVEGWRVLSKREVRGLQQVAANPVTALRTLSWTGTGKVFPPGRTLELGVETSVTPFETARSDTWILSEGRSTMRSMIIEQYGGWTERGGKREPMSPLMLKQERQQFAIYGQMQMALARAASTPQRRITIEGDGIRSATTTFEVDDAGRLVGAENAVADDEKPGATVAQTFKFSGEIAADGLRWPKHMEMYRSGQPYFVLDISKLTVR